MSLPAMFQVLGDVFVHYGVQLWVPEVGERSTRSEAHDLVMSVFGGMSKGERNRIRIRVRTAMAAQAHIEGGFLRAAHRTGINWWMYQFGHPHRYFALRNSLGHPVFFSLATLNTTPAFVRRSSLRWKL